MLAWAAAFLLTFAAVSDMAGIQSSSSLLSWPVLACTAGALLALDQALRQPGERKVKSGSDEKEGPG